MNKLKFVVLGHVPPTASYSHDANTTVNISQSLCAYEVTTAKVLKGKTLHKKPKNNSSFY
jgi:hypothetical protein